MTAEPERREVARVRHRLRAAAHGIVGDCTLLIANVAKPGRQHWREAADDALLAAQQLRALVERQYDAAAVTVSREDVESLMLALREPQRRIVKAMTHLLTLAPTDFDEELLLGDARAIRDAALRLGSDEPAQATDTPAAAARAPRILVVDDEDLIRRLLVMLLEDLRYETVAVKDGAAAMAIAEREQIDLILSDIQMPGCDGFELLKRLKANETTREIPVIVVSGTGDMTDVVRCIELGAEDHIAKPFDRHLLQARLRASVDRKRLRDQERDYVRRVALLTRAAEAVERGSDEPDSLDGLAAHDDELGRLARVFDRVVSGWRAREAPLERPSEIG